MEMVTFLPRGRWISNLTILLVTLLYIVCTVCIISIWSLEHYSFNIIWTLFILISLEHYSLHNFVFVDIKPVSSSWTQSARTEISRTLTCATSTTWTVCSVCSCCNTGYGCKGTEKNNKTELRWLSLSINGIKLFHFNIFCPNLLTYLQYLQYLQFSVMPLVSRLSTRFSSCKALSRPKFLTAVKKELKLQWVARQ